VTAYSLPAAGGNSAAVVVLAPRLAAVEWALPRALPCLGLANSADGYRTAFFVGG